MPPNFPLMMCFLNLEANPNGNFKLAIVSRNKLRLSLRRTHVAIGMVVFVLLEW
jgi:hypothetical protein